MTSQPQNTAKTLAKALWTNLKTGFVILTKELCWMAGGFSHKMEIRQLQKQAGQEEAALGRRLLEAFEDAKALDNGATQSIAMPKDAEAIRDRILFIREEVVRLEKLRVESRKHHEAKIRDRFQQDQKEAEAAAEPVVWDTPDIPYTPDLEGFNPEKTNPTMDTDAGKIPTVQADATPKTSA